MIICGENVITETIMLGGKVPMDKYSIFCPYCKAKISSYSLFSLEIKATKHIEGCYDDENYPNEENYEDL